MKSIIFALWFTLFQKCSHTKVQVCTMKCTYIKWWILSLLFCLWCRHALDSIQWCSKNQMKLESYASHCSESRVHLRLEFQVRYFSDQKWLKLPLDVWTNYYGQRIKILHGCPFKGWPNRAWPSKPFLPKRVGWPCPVRSALKRTPVHDFNSFSIIFYYIITTTYQKIEDLFCPVHISGLFQCALSYDGWYNGKTKFLIEILGY